MTEREERERAQASWMPNDMVTAGNRAPQVEFPSSALPVLWMCTTVFAWFTPSLMDCRVWFQVIAFGGPSRFTMFCAHLWQKTPAILKWSSTILTVTHTHIYIIFIYIYVHVHMCIYIHVYVCVFCLFDPPKLLNPSLLKDENLLIQFCG